MRKYHQLTPEQRYTIYSLKKVKYSNREIAKIIHVDPSTIGREIKRNSGERGYRYKQAQRKSDQRRSQASKRIKLDFKMQALIRESLENYFSPEQIFGTAKQKDVPIVSIERIYQHIWDDKRQGGTLYKFLRIVNKKKRKRYGRNDKRGQIKNRRWIDDRPEVAEQKARIGDFELDTIVGKGRRAYLITAVGRKSKFTIIGKSDTKQADSVTQKIIDMLKPYKTVLHTLTGDNGKEFAWHEKIAENLDVDFYFAHPYCSWERGLNENTNGLIRQFFPKYHDFRKITQNEIETVMNLLNNRPRKTLGFKTPNQVFWAET
jgi:transposase, IS30 family